MTAAAVASLLGITQSAVTKAAGRAEALANDQRDKLISSKK
jgi:predicted transcriptional regulator